jgi:hypothetical protein
MNRILESDVSPVFLGSVVHLCYRPRGPDTDEGDVMNTKAHDTAARLRALTDFLDQLPDDFEQQPSIAPNGSYVLFSFNTWSLPCTFWGRDHTDDTRGAEIKRRFKETARVIGGRWAKNDPKKSAYDDENYIFTHAFGLPVPESDVDEVIEIRLIMPRDLVCERVQVGTEEKVVPAVEAQPERVEKVPVFERDCKPLFAEPAELDKLAAELEAAR